MLNPDVLKTPKIDTHTLLKSLIASNTQAANEFLADATNAQSYLANLPEEFKNIKVMKQIFIGLFSKDVNFTADQPREEKEFYIACLQQTPRIWDVLTSALTGMSNNTRTLNHEAVQGILEELLNVIDTLPKFTLSASKKLSAVVPDTFAVDLFSLALESSKLATDESRKIIQLPLAKNLHYTDTCILAGAASKLTAAAFNSQVIARYSDGKVNLSVASRHLIKSAELFSLDRAFRQNVLDSFAFSKSSSRPRI